MIGPKERLLVEKEGIRIRIGYLSEYSLKSVRWNLGLGGMKASLNRNRSVRAANPTINYQPFAEVSQSCLRLSMFSWFTQEGLDFKRRIDI